MNNSAILLLAGGMDMSERASTAGIVTLQGMLTIFLVLSLLWAAIEVMHGLLHRGRTEKTDEDTPKKSAEPSAPATSDAAIAAAIAAALAASEDEGATVAAITAAISAAMAEEGYTGGFRVVSFKRVSANNRRNRV